MADHFVKYINQLPDADTRDEMLKLFLLNNKLTKYNQICLNQDYPIELKASKAMNILVKFVSEGSMYCLQSVPEEVVEQLRQRADMLT